MAAEDASGPRDPIADRIERLFATVHPPDRGPYKSHEVAEMTQRTPHPLSAPYVRQLRAGRRINPTVGSLRALAEVFGVPLVYFFDDREAERFDADLALAQALASAGVEAMAEGPVATLSAASKKALAEIIKQMQAVDEAHRATAPAATEPTDGDR